MDFETLIKNVEDSLAELKSALMDESLIKPQTEVEVQNQAIKKINTDFDQRF